MDDLPSPSVEIQVNPTAPDAKSVRHDRPPPLAFIADARTEAVLREGLASILPDTLASRRGGVRAAIAALKKMPTPQALVVDVSGEDQPLQALADLSEVVEPTARVLVVGESRDVDFYRQVTRGLGALEYLSKPLTRDMVARYFGPLVAGDGPTMEMNGGRLVTVTGVCGGVGATTIAANLAWHFALYAHRHTVLLDADLHLGAAGMMLDAKTGPGLGRALEAPQRVDPLFVERAAQPVADRLHLLAGEEPLSEMPAYVPGAAAALLAALRCRYNFIVADTPFAPLPLNRDLLDLAGQRVLVMTPTLAGIRATLRLLSLPAGAAQKRRAMVVMNRGGLHGGLSRRQVQDALKMTVDVEIPDMPRQLGIAASLGEPAVKNNGTFRACIAEVARTVAFERLIDSTAATAEAGRAGGTARAGWRLFRGGP